MNSLIQLNGSGSTDVDGDALRYQWSLLSTPGGSAAVLSSASSVTPTFTADKGGDYVVQLIVFDGTVESSPDTATISVDAPLLVPAAMPDPARQCRKARW